MKKISVSIIAFLCVAFLSGKNIHHTPDFDSLETIFQRIQNYQQIVIIVNFDSLNNNRRSNKEHPAQVVLKGQGQPELKMATKIRPRGRFRRQKCAFMPLRLNFEKTDLKSMNIYQKYDKLKLVTHCGEGEVDGQVVLKEYWTYKLYNEVTDSSFRVHLLDITYINVADTTHKIQSYAFFIENVAELTHRLNGEIVEELGIPSTSLLPNSYQEFLLFNYMVGNTDWTLEIHKNLKIIKHPTSDFFTIVPYDFDFAKIVDSPYLRISKTIPNLDGNNRAAIDQFRDKESLRKCLEKFHLLRKTGFSSFKKCPFLTKQAKKEMAKFLNSFFMHAKNRKYMEKVFLGN